MAKRIVLCLDGTWNAPDVQNPKGTCYTPTNVQKVFEWLRGSQPLAPTDQEREFAEASGTGMPQVGKYIYGVGADTNWLASRCQGALGDGLITRVVRGYTYLSRQYQPGDDIVIVGFSRGSYTARALAGFVTHQGLLNWRGMALDPDGGAPQGYSAGLAAWLEYKKTLHNDEDLVNALTDVVGAFAERHELTKHPSPPLQFIPNVPIRAVAVWDTVGSLGVPDLHDANGTLVRKDVYQFADLNLGVQVLNGFHAVSVDECRVDFTPTLWNDREGVVQVLFPGAHSDVGGGYDPTESGLAYGALQWMRQKLSKVGVEFQDPPPWPPCTPNAQDIQHQPWGGTVFLTAPRIFRPGLLLSASVLQRAAAGQVPVEEQHPAPYRPANLLGSYVLAAWSQNNLAPGVVIEV